MEVGRDHVLGPLNETTNSVKPDQKGSLSRESSRLDFPGLQGVGVTIPTCRLSSEGRGVGGDLVRQGRRKAFSEDTGRDPDLLFTYF